MRILSISITIHEKFIGICSEYGVSNDLTKWRNQKYFSTWQSRAWETGKPGMSYINENSFSRWIIEKSNGLTTLGLQKLSESVRDYAYLILTAQTSVRAQIIGHEARNLDAQRVFLNNFENIINRRVDISEDIQRFQKTLQYARSKVDYAVAEYVYLLPSDMDLRIGKIRRYNNKILIASPSFKIGTNLKINLLSSDRRLNGDEEKGKPGVKPKVITKPNIKPNKEHKQDVHWALPFEHSSKGAQYKPNIKFNQDVKKPDLLSSQFNYVEKRSKLNDKITIEPSLVELNNYEEEKVALILGTTDVFTVWWMFK